MTSTLPLQSVCKACGTVHPIEGGQFPPGVLELLHYDDGLIWDKHLIGHCWRNRAEPPDYPGAMADIKAAIGSLKPKAVLTVGSMSPWIEAAISTGCDVTVTELRPIRVESDVISYAAPEVAYARKYDAVISYSSVEHFGLGRYGDDLDPGADKKWMRMIRDCISPGGRLLLAVPVGPAGKVEECYHRLYGPAGLADLTAGYKIETVTRGGQLFNEVPFVVVAKQDWQNQPLLTLEPV
jgi:hypothetical protein